MDVVYQLDREWSLLARREVTKVLPRWRERQPALRGFSSPRDLLEFLHAAAADRTDAPLLALLVLAREDPLAGRTLLQVLLPALKTRADRILHPAYVGRDEIWELLLYAAWEAICCYPLERRRVRVAANLILQVIHQTTRELRRLSLDHDESIGHGPERAAPRHPLAPEAVVLSGVAAGVISADDADLILLTRVDGIRLPVVARTLGVGYHALRQRRQRAEKQLRRHLAESVDVSKEPVSDPVFHAETFLRSRRERLGTPARPEVRADRAA